MDLLSPEETWGLVAGLLTSSTGLSPLQEVEVMPWLGSTPATGTAAPGALRSTLLPRGLQAGAPRPGSPSNPPLLSSAELEPGSCRRAAGGHLDHLTPGGALLLNRLGPPERKLHPGGFDAL